MHGIESLHLTKEQRDRLDVFQLKGLGHILKSPTTFGQIQRGETPTWDDPIIKQLVNATKKNNTWEERKKRNRPFQKS